MAQQKRLFLEKRYTYHILLVFAFLIYPTLSDLESGFSQGCYSACPRKIYTLQNTSRQEVDKEWINCLKQCHQVDSWRFIVIVCAIVVILTCVCILVLICWGQKIRIKYTFHIERKKRSAITTEDQTKIKVFEQGLKKFKETVLDQFSEICIQFQNDNQHKKTYFIQDSIFHNRQNHQLQNMFSIILYSKKDVNLPQKQRQMTNMERMVEDRTEIQIQNESVIEEQEYSQLIGAITLTNKGMNLWWIKIDDKPEDEDTWCKWCSRKNKKYFAVYEKDPFVPEGSFIGNVVLEDSSKKAEQRYTKYTIRRKQKIAPVRLQQVSVEV